MVKKQHYISRKLIEPFVDAKGNLYEFLVGKCKTSYISVSANAMSENYTYETQHLEVNAVEEFLGREIDSKIPIVIRKIFEIIEGIEKDVLKFAALKLYMRVNMHFFLKNYYRSNALLTEFSFHDEAHKIPHLLKHILDKQYIGLLSDTLSICYKAALLKSEDGNFLLSDQYISTAALAPKSHFIHLSNRSFGLKEIIILIPISSKYYYVLWHSNVNDPFIPDTINKISEETLYKINQVIVDSSYRKCLGMNKEIADKFCLRSKQTFPTQTFSESWSYIKKKEVFWYERDRLYWKSFTMHIPPKDFEIGRNEECKCGSGKKYKKCHLEYAVWWDNVTRHFEGSYPFIDITPSNWKNFVVDGARAIEAPVDSTWRNG